MVSFIGAVHHFSERRVALIAYGRVKEAGPYPAVGFNNRHHPWRGAARGDGCGSGRVGAKVLGNAAQFFRSLAHEAAKNPLWIFRDHQLDFAKEGIEAGGVEVISNILSAAKGREWLTVRDDISAARNDKESSSSSSAVWTVARKLRQFVF